MSGKGSARRPGAGYEDAWERIFGKKARPGCQNCGFVGIHACPGAPIPPWTEEEKAELETILDEFEGHD